MARDLEPGDRAEFDLTLAVPQDAKRGDRLPRRLAATEEEPGRAG